MSRKQTDGPRYDRDSNRQTGTDGGGKETDGRSEIGQIDVQGERQEETE